MGASQAALAAQIDALQQELERIRVSTENAGLPPLTPYVKKLASSRKRLGKLNSTLATIAERMDRMSRQYGVPLMSPDEAAAAAAGAVEAAGGDAEAGGNGEEGGASDGNDS